VNLFAQIPLNASDKDSFTCFPAIIEHSQIPTSTKSSTSTLEEQLHSNWVKWTQVKKTNSRGRWVASFGRI